MINVVHSRVDAACAIKFFFMAPPDATSKDDINILCNVRI